MFVITQGFLSERYVLQGYGLKITPGFAGGGGSAGYATPHVHVGHFDDWRARQQDMELLELTTIITRILT